MYLEMFLRLFSDCCLFFALMGCCPSLLPYSYPLPATALIFGLIAALSAFLGDKGRKKLARACVVLPFLTLLFAAGWQEMLLLILPILYTCAVVCSKGLYMDYYGYSKFFRRTLIILFSAWALIRLITYFEDPQDLYEDLIRTDVILQYALIFFACGVVLQRQLRLGSHNRSRTEAGQLAGILGCVGSVGIGFILTEPLLRQSCSAVLRNIFTVLLTPFVWLQELFYYFSEKIKDMYRSEEYLKEIEDNGTVGYLDQPEIQGSLSYLAAKDGKVGHSLWVIIVAIVAVLIILILAVFAFTRLRSRAGSPLTQTAMKKSEKKKRLPRLSNRNKVRQAYRDFLHYQRSHGVRIKTQYTTADILSRVSHGTNRGAAAELREVYLRARYDEQREVDPSQVNAARDALKQIKKN